VKKRIAVIARHATCLKNRYMTILAAAIFASAIVAPETASAVGSSSIVRNLSTGLCLFPTSGSPGTAIYQAPCDGDDIRSFGVEYVDRQGLETPNPKGFFRLRSVQTNMCVDLANASNGNGVPVVQHPCSGSLTQQWSIQGPIGLVGYYQLVNRSGGKCLDAVVNGPNIQQWQCLTVNNQSWWTTF
jgi:Ricin-type beta-trefoil lectin domain-like